MKPRLLSAACLTLPLATALAALAAPLANAADGEWTGAGDLNWNSTGNWVGGTIAGNWNNVLFSNSVVNGTVNNDVYQGHNNITVASGCTQNIVINGPQAFPIAAGAAITVTGADLTFNTAMQWFNVGTQTWDVAAGRTLTLNGALSPNSTVTQGFNKTGDGTAWIKNSNTNKGSNTLTAGTLILGSTTALGTGALTINGGTLDSSVANLVNANNNAQNWDGNFGFAGTQNLNLGTGAVTLGASVVTLTTSANTLTIGGVISGSGRGLTKSGAGTLTLTGANTYDGGTTISNGTLKAGNANALGSGSITLAGGTLDLNGYPITNSITNNGGTITNATTAAIGGTISGTGALTKSGAGTLTLMNANYSGGTTISAGTLKAVTIGSGAVTVASGATWDLGLHNQTVAGLSGAGNVACSSLLATGADGSTLISSSKNYVQKLDFGSGAGATVNGVTFDNAGTSGTGWSLTGSTSQFPESGSPTGYAQLMSDFYYSGNPGVLTFTGLAVGKVYEVVLYTQVGSWPGRPQTATFANGSNSEQLPHTDPGTVGYYAYRFSATDTSASITMTPDVPANTFHWFGASLEDLGTPTTTLTIGDSGDYAFSGGIGGPVSLTKQGTGTQTLAGANTYTGGTTVSAGTLLVNNTTGSGTGSGTVAVDGGTLGGTGTLGGAVTVAAAGSVAPGASAGTLTINGGLDISAMANGGTGKLRFELGPISGSDKIALTGTLTIGSGVLDFSDFVFTALTGLQDGTYKLITGGAPVSGPIAGSGLSGAIGAGTGTLQISGNDLELVVTGIGGGSAYEIWSGFAPFNGDANGDGVTNGMAWMLGAANKDADATGLLPEVSKNGTGLVMTFDCLSAANRGTAVLNVQHSGDLGLNDAWAAALVPGTEPLTVTVSGVDFVTTANGALIHVVATIPSSGNDLAGKLFGRLKASETP